MAVRTPTWRSLCLAAPLTLALALSACSDDAGTLSHVDVGRTVVDPETSQTTTVNGYVPDIPLPQDADPGQALDDPVVVAVDLTVEIGPHQGFTVRPADFELRTSSGDVSTALTSVTRTLQDESLWPFTEAGPGSTQRGWVAFAVDRSAVAGSTLVAHRPAALTVDGRGSLPAATFDVELRPAG